MRPHPTLDLLRMTSAAGLAGVLLALFAIRPAWAVSACEARLAAPTAATYLERGRACAAEGRWERAVKAEETELWIRNREPCEGDKPSDCAL